jgi:hypothetical protein
VECFTTPYYSDARQDFILRRVRMVANVVMESAQELTTITHRTDAHANGVVQALRDEGLLANDYE